MRSGSLGAAGATTATVTRLAPKRRAYLVVLARAALTYRKRDWDLYRLAEVQGLVDLLLASSAACDGSESDVLHLRVCADLSRRSEDFGLSVDPFPARYQ